MRNIYSILTILCIAGIFLYSEVCSAQMINWARRRKNLQRKAESTQSRNVMANQKKGLSSLSPQRQTASPKSQQEISRANISSLQEQRVEEVLVTNGLEEKYDVNGDGKLQLLEVKNFLKAVLLTIESKGWTTLDSPLLRKYDANNDGLVSRYEAEVIKEDVRN